MMPKSVSFNPITVTLLADQSKPSAVANIDIVARHVYGALAERIRVKAR